jgi:hypothetical protein
MDTIKGLALIATFIGFLTIFAMWVSLWDNVWRVSVEPTRASIYCARIGPSHCLSHSWIMVVDRGLSPDTGNGARRHHHMISPSVLLDTCG